MYVKETSAVPAPEGCASESAVRVPAASTGARTNQQRMTAPRHRPCPPVEVLAAFTDDLLCQPRHLWTIEHVADCDHCYPVVAGLLDFQALEAERGEGAPS